MKPTLKTGLNLLATPAFIGKYTLEGTVNALKNRNNDTARRQKALEITSRIGGGLLDFLNVHIETKQSRPDLFNRNYFMVCNHMSYIDILVLSKCQPAVFVTSVEMEKTFFLGDMAKLGGSFFVNRINRRKIKEEVAALQTLLEKGFNVFIFPEGTSTDGQELLPFKKSLFRVPFQAKDYPILPICLKYESIDGEPFGPNNCDKVCWYGDMTFAPHILQLMKVKEMRVKVQYLDPLFPENFADHGALTQEAFRQINEAYQNS